MCVIEFRIWNCLQSDERPGSFWDFVHAWWNEMQEDKDAGSECWKRIESQVSQFLTPRMQNVFATFMSLRFYSPRLQIFQKLSEGSSPSPPGCCWVDVGGSILVSTDDLSNKIIQAAECNNSSNGNEVYPFDHIYVPSGTIEEKKFSPIDKPLKSSIILYAPIGAPCAARFHAGLTSFINSNTDFVYVWRPIASDKCSTKEKCTRWDSDEKLLLSGFGVEFYIKNMEYNARDEEARNVTEVNKSNQSVMEHSVEYEENYLHKIAGKYSNLSSSLIEFHNNLFHGVISGDSEITNDMDMKIQNLGLQASKMIVSATDPLSALEEISQNFPTVASSLAQFSIDHSLKKTAKQLSSMLPLTFNYLSLDGSQIDIQKELNVFQIMKAIRREIRLLDILSEIGYPGSLGRNIALTRSLASPKENELRIYLNPTGMKEIIWLTDVEKDVQFLGLPKSLQVLMQPMFLGQVPAARRNVFNAIIVSDPASFSTFQIFYEISVIKKQGWPIRIGFMPSASGEEARQTGKKVDSIRDKASRIVVAVLSSTEKDKAIDFMADSFKTFLKKGIDKMDDVNAEQEIWKIVSGKFSEKWIYLGIEELRDSPSSAMDAILNGERQIGQTTASILQGSWQLSYDVGLTSLLVDSSQSTFQNDAVIVFNGLVSTLSRAKSLREEMGLLFQNEMHMVQRMVYNGILEDGMRDIYEAVLKAHQPLSRYNPRLLSHMHSATVIDPKKQMDPFPPIQILFDGPEAGMKAIDELEITYFHHGSLIVSETKEPLITHWVVLSSWDSIGFQLIADALQELGEQSRLGILMNPEDNECNLYPVDEVVLYLTSEKVREFRPDLTNADFVDLFTGLSSESSPLNLSYEGLAQLLPDGFSIEENSLLSLMQNSTITLKSIAYRHLKFVRNVLKMLPRQNGIVTNGRVVVARWAGDIVAADIPLLEENAVLNQFVSQELLKQRSLDSPEVSAYGANLSLSDSALIASSALAVLQGEKELRASHAAISQLLDNQRENGLIVSQVSRENKSTSISPSRGKPPPLLLQAVLDPLSKTTQQISTFLKFLRRMIPIDIEILLKPTLDYSNVPLTAYYRFAIPDISFLIDSQSKEDGGAETSPAVVFDLLPQKKTLTLEMDVPESWLVTPIGAAQDLDNLRLDELPAWQKYTSAMFELESLIATGMCVDLASLEAGKHEGIHPRGVQLELRTSPMGTILDDTLVMTNLGYFQLKTLPGVWSLQLAPGRSDELFSIEQASGASTSHYWSELGDALQSPLESNRGTVPVAVDDFSGRHILLLLRKNPSKLDEDVLDVSPLQAAASLRRDDSIWGQFKGIVRNREDKSNEKSNHMASIVGPKNASTTTENDNTIHVFTVASGHMYERLQKIMILSAIKRSSRKIKFWFIENYMSPQMKSFLPFMAKEYGFDFE